MDFFVYLCIFVLNSSVLLTYLLFLNAFIQYLSSIINGFLFSRNLPAFFYFKITITRQRHNKWLMLSWTTIMSMYPLSQMAGNHCFLSETPRQHYAPFSGTKRADNRCLNCRCISQNHWEITWQGERSQKSWWHVPRAEKWHQLKATAACKPSPTRVGRLVKNNKEQNTEQTFPLMASNVSLRLGSVCFVPPLPAVFG